MTQAELHCAIYAHCQASVYDRDRLVARLVALSVLADPRTTPDEAASAVELALRGERTLAAETLTYERMAIALSGQYQEVA